MYLSERCCFLQVGPVHHGLMQADGEPFALGIIPPLLGKSANVND
jgi:hypothetical protein